VLRLDTCPYTKGSSKPTTILSEHLTGRHSEAQRSPDTCLQPIADRTDFWDEARRPFRRGNPGFGRRSPSGRWFDSDRIQDLLEFGLNGSIRLRGFDGEHHDPDAVYVQYLHVTRRAG